MALPTVANTSRPRSQGLHCRIDETFYRLVSVADMVPTIQTAPLQPPRIDTAVNPEDIRPESGTLFSLTNMTGGEGLDFVHRRTETTRDPSTRFWSSSGIDVARTESGEPLSISLLHDTESIESISGSYARGMVYNDEVWITVEDEGPGIAEVLRSVELPNLDAGLRDVGAVLEVDDEVVARGEGRYEEARAIEGIPPELWLAVRGDLPCHPGTGRPLLHEWYLASGDLTPADLERWGPRVANMTLPLDPESTPDGSP